MKVGGLTSVKLCCGQFSENIYNHFQVASCVIFIIFVNM